MKNIVFGGGTCCSFRMDGDGDKPEDGKPEGDKPEGGGDTGGSEEKKD